MDKPTETSNTLFFYVEYVKQLTISLKPLYYILYCIIASLNKFYFKWNGNITTWNKHKLFPQNKLGEDNFFCIKI